MRTLLLAVALTAAFAAVAQAQDYPTHPVTLIVPTATGGGNDVVARVLGERMSRTLGQPFVIENHGGAGGTIATRQLARSAPDGYTLALGNSGTVGMAPSIYPNAGYDPRKDFAPIGLIASSTVVLVVNPAVPARSVQELIALAKSQPGKLTFGTGGSGSGSHLMAEQFASMAGIKLTHVPFRGLGPAMNDLIGGHITMIFSSIPSAIGNIKSGNLRALATTGLKRSSFLPDLPTIDEAGLKGYDAAQVYGLLAPAGTPPAIVAKLNKALRDALTADDVKARIAGEGAEPLPGTPDDYAQDIDREEKKWSKVVKDAAVPQEQ